MPAFIDTHCHLNLDPFSDDLADVLERAEQAGVVKILVPGVDRATSQKAVELSEQFPQVYAAVGIHPNNAEDWNEQNWEAICDLANQPKVVAIGEIGLDYYRDASPREVQIDLLHKHLGLAAKTAKPVIIHNRQAIDDLWPILEAWQAGLEGEQNPLAGRPGVMHSFDGSLELAAQVKARQFFVSLSGPITFQNAKDRQEFAANLSLDRTLIETDSPYLAPHPKRGRRNEPAYVKLIAEKLSELQGIPLEKIGQLTTDSANKLFLWRSSD